MNLSSTRKAIHDAFALGWIQKGDMGMMEWAKYGCRIDRTRGSNNSANIVDCVEAGYILKMISTLDPHTRAWLRYAYHFEDRLFDRGQVAEYVRFTLFGQPQEVHKYQRHLALCEVAAEDYRLRIHTSHTMPIDEYGKAMKVNISHWARDWRNKQHDCLDLLKSVDADGIGRVSQMVKALRGQSEARPHDLLENRA